MDYCALAPTQEEQDAQKEQRTGNDEVNRPMKSAPKGDQIEHAQDGEEQGPRPFPAPGHGQDEQQQARRNEVDQQRKERVPETLVSVKHVQRKQTDESGKEEAKDPRSPEQETSR